MECDSETPPRGIQAGEEVRDGHVCYKVGAFGRENCGLYRTIAIKSRQFETRPRIPMTVIKTSYDLILVPTIPGKVLFNIPPVVFSIVIAIGFPLFLSFRIQIEATSKHVSFKLQIKTHEQVSFYLNIQFHDQFQFHNHLHNITIIGTINVNITIRATINVVCRLSSV